MNWKAARDSALLCALFLLVYGGANRFTALRGDVGTIHAAWERTIPFVPAMIVPYMSIDLFFIAAPFVCRDARERRTHARRVVTAVVVAGVCFLLFPLRFAFDRPHADGALGLIFDHFRALDQPFNQFPSLHIALQMILLPVFARRTRGPVRVLLSAWFALIAASTLLTYQHHAIDVVGGAVLGAACLHLFREDDAERLDSGNMRVGCYYAFGSSALLVAGSFARPWGMLLLWPAMATGIVAAGYFGLGSGVFRKRDGKLPITTRCLLAPVLVGQRLSLAYYARRSAAWDEVSDRIWIGRRLNDREAAAAINGGVRAVVDITSEFSEAGPFRQIPYLSLPVMDLTAATRDQLNRAVAFIAAHAPHGAVFVHCKAGYSRAATVVGAYLLKSGEVETVDEAVARLRTARPRIVIRPEAMRALADYAEHIARPTRPAGPRRRSHRRPPAALAAAPSPTPPAR